MSRHDRAAALWIDGNPTVAIAEERIDRRKRSKSFFSDGVGCLPPLGAITYVLDTAGICADDIDLVVCGRSMSGCLDDALKYLPFRREVITEIPVPSHHLAHAYSAAATAPFDTCAVLVIDEQGHHVSDRFESISWFSADAKCVKPVKSFYGSHDRMSLGMMYDLFSGLVGLSEAGLPAAGKLMALSAFGNPSDMPVPEWLILEEEGGAWVSPSKLGSYLASVGVPQNSFERMAESQNFEQLATNFIPIHWDTTLAMNLASVAQHELERALLHTASLLRKTTGLHELAYAGGVALNCVANSHLQEAGFSDAFVHPAATDDGIAMGLAAYGSMQIFRSPHRTGVFSPFQGRKYASIDCYEALARYGLDSLAVSAQPCDVAKKIMQEEIVCWFSERSEWGPRALGARSILADPRIPGIVDTINKRIKYRERFRPFGVSILDCEAKNLLDLTKSLPGLDRYMLSVSLPLDPRLFGLQHIDGTIRHQIVTPDSGAFYVLLQSFREVTGLGALLNTSFNTWGEPLVESPRDAVRQFLLSGADALFLQGVLISSSDIPEILLVSARQKAQDETHVKPLARARALEACGYPQAALAIARTIPSDLTHGLEHEISRSSLMMRLLAQDEPPEALRNADQVLAMSGLGRPAREAVDYIGTRGGSDAVHGKQAVALLRALAPRGGALLFAQQLFLAEDNDSK